MIFVNFKTYEQGSGENALSLLKVLESVSHESQIKVIAALQVGDIKEGVSSTTLEVWSQKIDPVEMGAHTGSILPESVLEDGAMGTFLNHSENKFMSFDDLAKASDRAKEVGLKSLIFASNLDELRNICSLNPNYVSIEPSELIGGSISVVSARPELVTEASEMARNAGIPLIVGAGIHTSDDIKKSLELGAIGVVVASDIVKSTDPGKELLDLTEGFK